MGVGILPESRKEEGLVSVRAMDENASYGAIERNSRLSIIPWRKVRKTVHDLIHSIGVKPPNPNLQVSFMSGGNQQKVVLARLLAANCDVLFLDEPTRGVDVGARMEIYKIIKQLKAEGKGILMVSSDLPEILTQSDRILVMAKGKIAGELKGSEATEEQVLSIALNLRPEVAHEAA
jgi:ribose transport system ATP-binding protein